MKKALIFGANGFIGSHLLTLLLADANYSEVTIVVRKKTSAEHEKLRVLIGDIKSLPNLKAQLVPDDVFIVLGTTKKKTPDLREYYEVDHDYPLLAAKLTQRNGAQGVFLVTAVGANANSKIFYTRTKGEVERDIRALGFTRTGLFRPSMLLGTRDEHRPLESSLISMWGAINPLLGGALKRYKGIDGEDVAKAMIKAARAQTEKVKIYHWAQMMEGPV